MSNYWKITYVKASGETSTVMTRNPSNTISSIESKGGRVRSTVNYGGGPGQSHSKAPVSLYETPTQEIPMQSPTTPAKEPSYGEVGYVSSLSPSLRSLVLGPSSEEMYVDKTLGGVDVDKYPSSVDMGSNNQANTATGIDPQRYSEYYNYRTRPGPSGLSPNEEMARERLPFVIERAGESAETLAQRRIQQEGVLPFQEQYGSLAQEIAQQTYDELMARKGQELGMKYEGGTWYYTSESQIKEFEAYRSVADEQATRKAQDYYSGQWELYKPSFESKAQEIAQQTYEQSGFKAVYEDGELKFVYKDVYKDYLTGKAIESKSEALKKAMTGSPTERLAGLGVWVTSGLLSFEDPLGIKSGFQAVTGDVSGAVETKARAMYDLNTAYEHGVIEYTKKVATGPVASIGIAYGTTSLLGAGVGTVKAAFPTVGKLVEIGIMSQATYDVGKSVGESFIRGGAGGGISSLGYTFATLPFAISGYKEGHAFGYGRTEAYLYKTRTYPSGSFERIRFEEALRIGRLLENIKSTKMQPLDFAKDIMRMDKSTAEQFTGFYRKHGGVVGGSAASYTQIVGARQPRDVDYFLQRLIGGTEKKVSFAKEFLPTKTKVGEHLIDIHGKEMYYPGKYHRFGFVSKESVKIDGYKFFTAGEQLMRKGVASVSVEAQYRWFKDVPDFITHARSLIGSAKESFWTRGRGLKAEQSLEIFLSPEKSIKYGVSRSSVFERMFKDISKPAKPISFETSYGYEYSYPSTVKPSYYIPSIKTQGMVIPSAKSLSYDYNVKEVKPSIFSLPSFKTEKIKPSYDIVKKDLDVGYKLVVGTKTSYPVKASEKYPSKVSQDYKNINDLFYPVLQKLGYKPSQKYGGQPSPGYPSKVSQDYKLLNDSFYPVLQKLGYQPTGYQAAPGYTPGYVSFGYEDQPPPPVDGQEPYDINRMRASSFYPLVKQRSDLPYQRASDIPFSREDAMSFAGHVVGNSAKASFKLEPTDERPGKLPGGIGRFKSYEYYYNPKKDTHVEKTRYRINSPGELAEITVKGIEARLRGFDKSFGRRRR